jgi:hypothetical protein
MSMLLAAAASGSASPPPPPMPAWLDDLIAAAAPGACVAGGTFTTGIEFNALTNATIKGIRSHWGTGFPPQTVRCTPWYASGPNVGTIISQEDVANVVGGAIFQTSPAFGQHQMVPGQQYTVTISVIGIANTYAASFPPFPSVYTNYSVIGDQSYRFWFGYGNYPIGASAGNGAYVEPIFL